MKRFHLLLVILLGAAFGAALAYQFTPPVAVGNLEKETEPDLMVTLTAVGDVVMHMPVINSAYNKADGSYDFRPTFAEIKESLEQADFTVGVLEAPLAEGKYTGYPKFNSPESIADALQWTGIDLVFTAHNHSVDQGFAGLRKTLDYLDKIELLHTGTRQNKEEKRYRIVDLKGIKLAFMSYTTTTNGITLPAGQAWAVNYLDYGVIGSDIEESRQAGANAIILALHTGKEYEREPSREQQEIVDRLIGLGVDIILGSHVHVIQPLESRMVEGANPDEYRTCFIAYSLGNLLSNQRWRYSDCGLMLTLKLRKTPGETGVRIVEASHAPLWVNTFFQEGLLIYRIKKLDGPEYYGDDLYVDEDDLVKIREVWNDTEELLEAWSRKKGTPFDGSLL